MKDGDIIEQGNHEELLAKNGFYAELLQFAVRRCHCVMQEAANPQLLDSTAVFAAAKRRRKNGSSENNYN